VGWAEVLNDGPGRWLVARDSPGCVAGVEPDARNWQSPKYADSMVGAGGGSRFSLTVFIFDL